MTSSRFFKIVVNPPPLSYEAPPFPSLYWPFPVGGSQVAYLYDFRSMWRFTVLWTLIVVIGIHLVASGYAVLVQWRNWKLIWIAPIVFAAFGALEAVIAGNVVGGLYVAKLNGSQTRAFC